MPDLRPVHVLPPPPGAQMMPRICPHEEQEIREGVWIAAVDYHFHCRCPDRRTWNCDHYICLCPDRRAVPAD